MLQVIREKTQGIVIWGIVILIVIAFTLIGNNYGSGFFGGSSIAAKVDGKKITWREIDSLAEKQRHYLASTNPQMLNKLDLKELRFHIQQYLIRQLALGSQLKKQGFLVSEQQVAKYIKDNPTFQEQGKFSAEKYKQFLKSVAENEASFTKNVNAGMVIDQPKNGFIASSFVLNNEIEEMLSLFFQQRDFGYLLVPADRFRNKDDVNKEDIEKHFQQHQNMFIAPEKVKLAYIELTIDALIKAISFTEEKLKEYYRKHENLYTIPKEIEVAHILINAPKDSDLDKSGEARTKIDDILARVKLGEDFSTLAKKYSEDPQSAPAGGNLGKISKGLTVPEFEQVAFSLTKDQALSDIVQTEYGYHIIKLLNTYDSYVKPFDSIREQLEENYRREIAESQFADKGEELANLAFEYPDSLQYAADKMQLPIKETELFSKEEPTGIASVPVVAKAAFDEELLAKNKNSDLLKVDDERYVIIRVMEHAPTRALQLKEVEKEIRSVLALDKAKKKAEEFGKKLLTKLQDGRTPYAIAKEADVEWIVEKDVERMNAKINAYLIRQAFSLAKPVAKKTTIAGFSLPQGDYVVLSLQKVKTSDKANEEHIKEQFKQQITMLMAQTEFGLYEQALISKAKIKVEN